MSPEPVLCGLRNVMQHAARRTSSEGDTMAAKSTNTTNISKCCSAGWKESSLFTIMSPVSCEVAVPYPYSISVCHCLKLASSSLSILIVKECTGNYDVYPIYMTLPYVSVTTDRVCCCCGQAIELLLQLPLSRVQFFALVFWRCGWSSYCPFTGRVQ